MSSVTKESLNLGGKYVKVLGGFRAEATLISSSKTLAACDPSEVPSSYLILELSKALSRKCTKSRPPMHRLPRLPGV